MTGTFSGRVAIISDPAQPTATLQGYVHWLRDLAGIDAVVAILPPGDLDNPATVVRSASGGQVTACFLVHTHPDRAGALRQALQAANLTVITENDLRAVTMAARALAELRRKDRTAGQSSVLIADSSQLPETGPLLTAVGVRDLTFWTPADAHVFPLARIASHADIVVDLRAEHDDTLSTPEQPTPSVIHAPAVTDSLTALPGLLTAATATRSLRVDIDVLAAVAQLLATTSADTTRPAPDLALTDSIDWVARQAMHHPRGS